MPMNSVPPESGTPEDNAEAFVLYRDDAGRQQVVGLRAAQPRRTIGRGAGNDVPLAWDAQVSRLHAQLERIGLDWVLVDDGLSRNGTHVNGERLAGRRRLRDGDTVLVGGTSLTYRTNRPGLSSETAAVGDVVTLLSLTPTQREILQALCRPYKAGAPYVTPATNQQIAQELYLSVDAVKTHLRTLYHKLRVEDLPQNQKRAKLVELAFHAGLVSERDL
jgi:pSer/pThr/pTyr-binding forkhead associated (FHA) protein